MRCSRREMYCDHGRLCVGPAMHSYRTYRVVCLLFTVQRHSQEGSTLSSSRYCSESPDTLQPSSYVCIERIKTYLGVISVYRHHHDEFYHVLRSQYPLHIFLSTCILSHKYFFLMSCGQNMKPKCQYETTGCCMVLEYNGFFTTKRHRTSHIAQSLKCTGSNLTDCCLPNICRTGVQIGLSDTSILA